MSRFSRHRNGHALFLLLRLINLLISNSRSRTYVIRSQMLQNVTSGTAVENHRMTHKRERARKGKDVKKTGGEGERDCGTMQVLVDSCRRYACIGPEDESISRERGLSNKPTGR